MFAWIDFATIQNQDTSTMFVKAFQRYTCSKGKMKSVIIKENNSTLLVVQLTWENGTLLTTEKLKADHGKGV